MGHRSYWSASYGRKTRSQKCASLNHSLQHLNHNDFEESLPYVPLIAPLALPGASKARYILAN